MAVATKVMRIELLDDMFSLLKEQDTLKVVVIGFWGCSRSPFATFQMTRFGRSVLLNLS